MMMIGWVALLLVAVTVAFTWIASPGDRAPSARARWDERLAAGDVSIEEHARRVAVLTDNRARHRVVSWPPLVTGVAVALLLVGAMAWAAAGMSIGSWGDHDRVMAEHMGWSPSADSVDRPVEGARRVEITATDLAFDRGVIRAQAREPVNITLVNGGAVFHDLSIAQLGFVLAVDPGERDSGSLTVEEPGSYEFVCSVPGHAQAGMRGTLEVT